MAVQLEIAENQLKKLSLSNEKVSQIESGNPRNKAFTKLNEILQNEKKSKNLEISIYNWTIQNIKQNKITPVTKKKGKKVIVNNNDLSWENSHFKRVYLSKYRTISFNLKNEKNAVFKENVLKNIIKTKDIVNMKPEEIYPVVWEGVFQKQIKKETIRLKNEEKEPEEAKEECFTCGKCKCKNENNYFKCYKHDPEMNQ